MLVRPLTPVLALALAACAHSLPPPVPTTAIDEPAEPTRSEVAPASPEALEAQRAMVSRALRELHQGGRMSFEAIDDLLREAAAIAPDSEAGAFARDLSRRFALPAPTGPLAATIERLRDPEHFVEAVAELDRAGNAGLDALLGALADRRPIREADCGCAVPPPSESFREVEGVGARVRTALYLLEDIAVLDERTARNLITRVRGENDYAWHHARLDEPDHARLSLRHMLRIDRARAIEDARAELDRLAKAGQHAELSELIRLATRYRILLDECVTLAITIGDRDEQLLAAAVAGAHPRARELARMNLDLALRAGGAWLSSMLAAMAHIGGPATEVLSDALAELSREDRLLTARELRSIDGLAAAEWDATLDEAVHDERAGDFECVTLGDLAAANLERALSGEPESDLCFAPPSVRATRRERALAEARSRLGRPPVAESAAPASPGPDHIADVRVYQTGDGFRPTSRDRRLVGAAFDPARVLRGIDAIVATRGGKGAVTVIERDVDGAYYLQVGVSAEPWGVTSLLDESDGDLVVEEVGTRAELLDLLRERLAQRTPVRVRLYHDR